MKDYYYGKGEGDFDGEEFDNDYASGEDKGYEKYVPYYDELDGDYKYLPADEGGEDVADYAERQSPKAGYGDNMSRLLMQKIEELNSKIEGKPSPPQEDCRINELNNEIKSLREQLFQLKSKDDIKRQFDDLKRELSDERGRREEVVKKALPAINCETEEKPKAESGGEFDAEKIIREIEKLNVRGFDEDLEKKMDSAIDSRVESAVKSATEKFAEMLRDYFEQLREENSRLVEDALAKSRQEGDALSQKLSEYEESLTSAAEQYQGKLDEAMLKFSEMSEKLEPKEVIDRDRLYAETMLDAISDIKADVRTVLQDGEDVKSDLKGIGEKLSEIADSNLKFDDELSGALNDFVQNIIERTGERLQKFDEKIDLLSESYRASTEELKSFISNEVESKFSQQNLDEFKRELSNALSLELKAEFEVMRQDYSIMFEQLGSKVDSFKEEILSGCGQLKESASPELEEKIAALEGKIEEAAGSLREELKGLVSEKAEFDGKIAALSETLARISDKLGESGRLEEKLNNLIEELGKEDCGALQGKIDEVKALMQSIRDSRSLDYDLSSIYTELRKIRGSEDLFGRNFEKVDANVVRIKEDLAEISKIEDENIKGE